MRDPATAPPRPDLAFLRRRSLRTAPIAAASVLAEFVSGHAHSPSAHSQSAHSQSPHSQSPHSQSAHSQAAAPPAPPAHPVASSSLDLDAPAASDAPAPAAAAPPQSAPGPTAPARASVRRPAVTRVGAQGRIVLDPTTPSVTLTRLQSGIGTITIDAACGAEVGDLRLGCAYRLDDGATSVISTIGERSAPAASRTPVLLAGHDQFHRISIDLRAVRRIERLMIYAFSESRAMLSWGGTVLISTHAGAHIEAPLVGLASGSVGVLVSAYQVGGELAFWTEMLAGTSVRDACRAFGFDDITWVDDRTPVR